MEILLMGFCSSKSWFSVSSTWWKWFDGDLTSPIDLRRVAAFSVWSAFYLLEQSGDFQAPSAQFSSVTQLCPTLCDPMNCSTPGIPAHHRFPEFNQTHVHWVGDAIQPSHPLSPPAFNLSQHQGLFKWVSSLHQVAKILKFQLQHQSFQWIFRTDFL